jgi:hypothetical protein
MLLTIYPQLQPMNWADRPMRETEGIARGGAAEMRLVIAVHRMPLLRVIWWQRLFSCLRLRALERPALVSRKAFEHRLAVCSERRLSLCAGAAIQGIL